MRISILCEFDFNYQTFSQICEKIFCVNLISHKTKLHKIIVLNNLYKQLNHLIYCKKFF